MCSPPSAPKRSAARRARRADGASGRPRRSRPPPRMPRPGQNHRADHTGGRPERLLIIRARCCGPVSAWRRTGAAAAAVGGVVGQEQHAQPEGPGEERADRHVVGAAAGPAEPECDSGRHRSGEKSCVQVDSGGQRCHRAGAAGGHRAHAAPVRLLRADLAESRWPVQRPPASIARSAGRDANTERFAPTRKPLSTPIRSFYPGRSGGPIIPAGRETLAPGHRADATIRCTWHSELPARLPEWLVTGQGDAIFKPDAFTLPSDGLAHHRKPGPAPMRARTHRIHSIRQSSARLRCHVPEAM